MSCAAKRALSSPEGVGVAPLILGSMQDRNVFRASFRRLSGNSEPHCSCGE
jgi:hypothetical protein